MAQPKTSKKLIIDYNKLRSLIRFDCPEHLIIQALKLEPVGKTGDELIDDILESLVDYREFDNWGGDRLGAGRKPKNQLENQDEKINLKIKMVKSSCVNQDVDKDIDIDNNIINNNISEIKNNRFINEFTSFKAGFQGWAFPPEIRKVATQHWSADEIRNIEKDFSCHEYETETTISDLLQIYPPKPKKKSYGEQQKVKLTDEEYAKLKELYGDYMDTAIDLLDRYLATNNKKYASHYAVMRKGNWVYNQIMKNKLDDERGF